MTGLIYDEPVKSQKNGHSGLALQVKPKDAKGQGISMKVRNHEAN
jgi:hypothetical protein